MANDQAPCGTCERRSRKPAPRLWPQNLPVWEAWLASHEAGRDGWSGRLRLEAVAVAARGDPDRIEEVLWLEREARARGLLKEKA